MASQSLPPPPLSCSTPPPIDDFSIIDEDEDDDIYDVRSYEHSDDIPSINNEDISIPVLDFHDLESEVTHVPLDKSAPEPPCIIDTQRDMGREEPVEVQAIIINEAVEPQQQQPPSPPRIPSISELLKTENVVITGSEEQSSPSPFKQKSAQIENEELQSDVQSIIVGDEKEVGQTCEISNEISADIVFDERHRVPSPPPADSIFTIDDENLYNSEAEANEIIATGEINQIDRIDIVQTPVDDGDDFTDFTSVHCDNTKTDVEAVKIVDDEDDGGVEETKELPVFEADFNAFANFESFSENAEQIPMTAPATVNNNDDNNIHRSGARTVDLDFVLNDTDNDDDDDEFGDFACSIPVAAAATIAVPPPTVKSTELQQMAVPEVNLNELDSILATMFPPGAAINSITSDLETAPGTVLKDIKQYETTALTDDYHWSKSVTNKCLVKCLGIDSRNILHGSKWGADMPRYAANLGFSPLQPTKSNAMPSSGSSQMEQKPMGETAGGGAEVPAVQFDWDNSGLVNPLNGGQAKNELTSTVEKEEGNNWTMLEANVVEGDKNNNLEPAASHQVEEASEVAMEDTIVAPLRETHIFTPIKGMNSVSREIDPDIESVVIAPTATSPTNPVREYHDVEYDPSKFLEKVVPKEESQALPMDCVKQKLEEEDDEFTDFQSVPASTTSPIRTSDALSVLSVNNLSTQMELPPKSVVAAASFKAGPEASFPKTVPTVSHCGNDGLLLKPQLVPSTYQQRAANPALDIQWPDNSNVGIDKSELDRIDEIFSKRNTNAIKPNIVGGSSGGGPLAPAKATPTEDDEWSDYVLGDVKVGVGPQQAANDDDWTDFISSNNGPNFTPWSAPSQRFQTPILQPAASLGYPSNGPNKVTPSMVEPVRINHPSGMLPDMKFVDPLPFFISTPSSSISPFGQVGRNPAKK